MKIFKTVKSLQNYLASKKEIINFVPTMGALHAGHIKLISEAQKNNALVVCSIFINPKQFNDPGDLKKYPVTTESDIDKLYHAECDILFLPDTQEIYPSGLEIAKYDLGNLNEILEGKFRSGHFQGVCIVVNRLLSIIKPNNLFLGQKDYQQCAVINKLLQITNSNCKLIIIPTQREKDGLAMSSRNVRLTEIERNEAPEIYKQLKIIEKLRNKVSLSKLKEEFIEALQQKNIQTEYIELADADDLHLKNNFDDKDSVLLFAGYLGGVRLIDNIIINGHHVN